MAKAVRCLNCGQMSGMHSFPAYHCPDHAHKGKFLADQTMRSDIGIPLRKRLLDALGWQGGTVADALDEVRRLKARVATGYVSAARGTLHGILNDRPTHAQIRELVSYALEALNRVEHPLGQGVAALLPEHGEAVCTWRESGTLLRASCDDKHRGHGQRPEVCQYCGKPTVFV